MTAQTEALRAADSGYRPARSRSRARRLLFPGLERSFTYDRYDSFLERLNDPTRFLVVPIRELEQVDASGRVVVGLRHDVDLRLDSAMKMAERERDRGVRSTYYVLHTAPYWGSRELVPALLRMQSQGHEIGWHNDLVTLQVVFGVDPRAYLERELASLRDSGVAIDGVASHGSHFCHRLGYHNNYFFADFDEIVPGFPHKDVVSTRHGPRAIEKATLAEFGFRYEAYHVDHDAYFSDSTFDAGGARWHPDELDLDELQPGTKVIVSTHPCHWDASVLAKTWRLTTRLAGSAADRIRRTKPKNV